MITQQIPDTLDLMGRALRSGHAFGDALRVAGEESPAPIGEEFGRAAEEHRLGIELRAALEGLAARTPENFELRMLVSGVMLNRETGGNLIEMLENMAEVVRERLVFEGKVKALTAEVRTSAAILSALPFFAALGIMWARPGYLEPLFEPGPGQYMLAYGLCSMVVGLFVMRRISDVEY
jgi:tight adherence protein B